MSVHARPQGQTTSQTRRRQGWKGTPGANGSWIVTVALAVLIFSSTNLLWPIFDTNSWSTQAIVLVAVMLGVAAITRTFTGSQLGSSTASLIAGGVVLVTRTFEGSPGATFEGWGHLAEQLVEQIRSDAAPLRETDAMTMLILLGVALITLLCDLFVFGIRGRSLAMLPLLAFPLVPMALGIDAFAWWAYALTAASLAVFLYAVSSWHQRVHDEELSYQGFLVDSRGAAGLGGALAVTATAVAAVLVGTLVIPPPGGIDAIRQASTSGLSTNRANPIIDLGEDLRRNTPVDVMRYATTTEQGALPYFTLQTLSDLSGDDDWMPGDFDGEVPIEGGDVPLPQGIVDGDSAGRYTARVVLNDGVSSFLPRPGFASSIVDLQGEFLLDEVTGDVRSGDDEALAQNYEIQTVVPRPTPAQIGAVDFEIPEELQPLTEVPDSEATGRIREVLEGIVDESAPIGAQALQLQAFFAEGFTYSESAPVTEGYDGTSLDVIAEFLSAKAGYCVHYSSAMAVMARMLGIPTRIGVGFTPGTPGQLNDEGQPVYTVTSDQLHAWAELYLPGHGWVMFETTPAGSLGNLVAPGPSDTPAPAETLPSESAVPTGEPTATAGEPTPTAEPTPTSSTDPSTAPGETGDEGGESLGVLGVVALSLLGLILVVGLLLLPAIARGLRRSRRRAGVLGARGGQPAGLLAWHEIVDSAIDFEVPLSLGTTPEGVVSAIMSATVEAPAPASTAEGEPDEPAELDDRDDRVAEALARLRHRYEVASFARPDATEALDAAERDELWESVLVVRAALSAAAPVRRRERARFMPASGGRRA